MNLREFSQELGLSQTTVSRALNGYPEVSEATRDRVEEAAKRLGYAPSANARQLATGQTRAIGHVVPQAQHEMINPHFSDFIAGAGEIYSERGYDLVMTLVSEKDELETYRRLVNSKKVDGFIIQAPHQNDARIALLQSLDIPFVVHGRTQDVGSGKSSHEKPVGFSWLDVNNRSAFKRATDLLLDLGHQRIALVNGLEHLNFAYLRRLGYLDAFESHEIKPDPSLMFSEDMTVPYGFEVASQLLALPEQKRPTAFLSSSVLPTMGIQQAVLKSNLRLGKDLSLVTFDDCLSFLGKPKGVPEITRLRSSIFEAGRAVATMLINQIENGESTKSFDQSLWEAELVLGHSTGPAQHPNNMTRDL